MSTDSIKESFISKKNVLKNCERMILDTICALNVLDNKIFDSQIYEVCKIISDASKNNSTVITTGMGKAGHIAQKASSSLSSLGIPSFYIHPGESSHGDIGVIREGDILIAFSTSGKTREVIETVNFARKLNIGKIVAITSHPDSVIRQKSDIVIDMGKISESGYLHIAPTTSIVIMLIIADMISTNVAQMNGFTMQDFYIRHHGGYLGKISKKESKK